MGDGGVGIEPASAVGERVWMNWSASFRVATLSRNWPRTADVTVTDPALRTPRIDMHRCSASMTTNTPLGCSDWSSSSAIWVVRRSWTWGRFERLSTRRASFDRPVMRPSSFGM